MQKYKLILIPILFVLSMFHYAQAQHKNHRIKVEPIKCNGHMSNDTTRVFVRRVPLKNTLISETNKAVFEFDFATSVPNEVKDAIIYAGNIWSDYLFSDVPIRVWIDWTSLESGVLGQTSQRVVSPDENLPDTSVYYPVALAEKIVGKELNTGDSYEFSISFNSDKSNWYFGIDGHPAFNQYDFVSTALHEMGHGLGFTATFNINDDGLGEYGWGFGIKKVFDIYIENGSQRRFVDDAFFENPSILLAENLTSDDVFFSGDYVKQQNGTSLPKLFAPEEWKSGSSISHLDDATYPKGNSNALMTHSTSSGEANHYPGKLVLDIFSQMGWFRTNISHSPIKDTEQTGVISVDAEIKSDVPANVKDYKLFYSFDTISTFEQINFTSTSEINYHAKIPVDNPGTYVYYYISANDFYNRKYRNPFLDKKYYSFYVGPDTIKPEITHYSIDYVYVDDDSVEIEASINDNIGIKSAHVEYFMNNESPVLIEMTNDSANVYTANLDLTTDNINDTVFYRIIAKDLSGNENTMVYPADAYFYFNVETTLEPVTEYFNDFNLYSTDFLGVKEQASSENETKFLISIPGELSDGCLHTPNPYLQTLENEEYYTYIAQLKYPIQLLEGAVLRFDEIVLVEPGEAGSKYGDEDFWDFVIVEASNDNGETWKELQPGYDCRLYREWEFLYNSNIVEDNSNATPTSSNYKSHHMSLLNKTEFSPGEIVFIRFRLNSDAFATGWGWAIDNLQIQGDIMSDDFLILDLNLDVYPNPGKNRVHVDAEFQNKISKINARLTDLSGKLIYSETFSLNKDILHWAIDVSNYNPGIYFLSITANNQQKTVKLMVY